MWHSCPTGIINWFNIFFSYFLKDFIYLFLEKGEGTGEREGEKHQCVVAFSESRTGDLAHNPGMCPDLELNQLWFAGWRSIH